MTFIFISAFISILKSINISPLRKLQKDAQTFSSFPYIFQENSIW